LIQKPCYWLGAALTALSLCVFASASDPNADGDIQGVIRNPMGEALTNATVTVAPEKTNVARQGFWNRLAKAYVDDWHDRTPPSPDPGFRADIPRPNPIRPIHLPFGRTAVLVHGKPSQTPKVSP
jgi:hypothetical protein